MPLLQFLRNRNFLALIVANTVFATAFPIQLILGGLAGLQLAPSAALATLPSSVQTLAALVAAGPFSMLMGRLGRGVGFAFGGILTSVGACLAIFALMRQDFVMLCLGHFLMGAGWASFQYFRFAASEVVAPTWRPVAISFMLSSGLFAALLGPQAFIAFRDALVPPPFAGAYLAVAAIGVLGLLPLGFLRIKARRTASEAGSWRVGLGALNRFEVRRAIAIAALSQGIMVFLMVPTPLAMVGCGLTEAAASDVVRWHIVAMFAPSFLTGFVIQRFGAKRVATAGLLVILVSAVVAATGLAVGHFYLSLIVLGVGWNLGFIGATTMLDAALTEREKPSAQGLNDTAIGLVSAIAAFGAGAMLAQFGWIILAAVSGTIVLIALVVLLAQRTPERPLPKP
ncbi:MFS transporter [Shimia ponticola]|uniref:MFS transporter n=1 Tax=Shimia ponticola TaxID=2582893 RepID=UPI0011BDB90F|nr:MFS transporter [Shimia ponticola]